MKTIAGLFVAVFLFVATAVVLVVSTVITPLVQLLPIVLLAGLVIAMVHLAASRRRPAGPPARARASIPPGFSHGGPRGVGQLGPQPVWGAPPQQPGWVLVPVWMGAPAPRHPGPVIDAEVIDGDDGHG
jgi:hypothetical protein